MTPTKPYLIRAIFEWCIDQGFVPYLTVCVDARTRVPREHVKEGRITLNIGPEATQKLVLGNEEITFQARFNGASFPVVAPVNAVEAIFARENGMGMAFEPTPSLDESPEAAAPAAAEPVEPTEPTPDKPRSHLTRVK